MKCLIMCHLNKGSDKYFYLYQLYESKFFKSYYYRKIKTFTEYDMIFLLSTIPKQPV